MLFKDIGLVLVLLLGGVVSEKLGLDISGNLLILSELHCKCGGATGEGAQSGGVPVELGERNAGVEDRESLVHVLVHDHTPTAIKVGHARTDKLVGGEDVNVVDRLKDLRASAIGIPF